MKDNLQQPYRGKLIKGYDGVIDKIYEYNALGAYLSGAGPTIMAITTLDDSSFINDMKSYLRSMDLDLKVIELEIDLNGAKVIQI